MDIKNKKIAIVCDWLTTLAGAEKVIIAITEIFPNADIYTSIYDSKMDKHFIRQNIKASFINKLPYAKKKHQYYFPLMPYAFESFDLSEYDIVISSSHSLAKGVITNPNTFHICYCHSPTRYLWDLNHYYLNNYGLNFLLKFIARYLLNKLRIWDRLASDRVDYFIANSNFISRRIKKYYKRESSVVYPFAKLSDFQCWGKREDYFITVCRLTPYKKIDLVIDAFKELGDELYIVGKGDDYEKYKKMNLPKNIRLLGYVDDDALKTLYAHAKGLIFPQIEDFGIVAIEALASGCPIIAYNEGGALETVKDGVNGVFFEEQSVKSLKKAVNRFNSYKFDIEDIVNSSKQFDESKFKEDFYNTVEREYKNYLHTNS